MRPDTVRISLLGPDGLFLGHRGKVLEGSVGGWWLQGWGTATSCLVGSCCETRWEPGWKPATFCRPLLQPSLLQTSIPKSMLFVLCR